MAQIAQKFLQLLELTSLLPKPDRSFTQKYHLSKQQTYLIYLISIQTQLNDSRDVGMSTFAKLLNISTSTLTRNVEKLEQRKVLERIHKTGEKIVSLRLLSLGQLYALEIGDHFEQALGNVRL